MFTKLKVFSQFFCFWSLLSLIINVNYYSKQIKTVTNNVTNVQKPLTIEEQYYQYTINNQVNEKYQVFSKILNDSIKENTNNPQLLKKYQQLKNNWAHQHVFIVNNKHGFGYYLLLSALVIIFIALSILILRLLASNQLLLRKSEYDIYDYLCEFKEFDISEKDIDDKINKFINDEIIGNEKNKDFYLRKFFLNHNYPRIINTAFDYWEKDYQINESFHQTTNCTINNCLLCKSIVTLKAKKSYELFWEQFQIMNNSNKIRYFTGNENFYNCLNAENESDLKKITDEIIELIFENLKKEIAFKESDNEKIILPIREVISEISGFITYSIKMVEIGTTDNNKIKFILAQKKEINKELCKFLAQEYGGYSLMNYHYYNDNIFFNFIKEDVIDVNTNLINKSKNKDEKKEFQLIKDDYYKDNNYKIIINKKQKIPHLFKIFCLIFINFLIVTYLFNGYQYLINAIKVLFTKNIKINSFTYVNSKKGFITDDGFVINKNGIDYYRLSNALTLRTFWRLIIQFIIDVLIAVFSIKILLSLGKTVLYYQRFIVFTVLMIIIKIFSIVYYCIPTWQQKYKSFIINLYK